jgi:hypothetical protein
MFLDWTNWTFWVTAIALVAFGFCLRDIYEQWSFRKVRKNIRDDLRNATDLTRRLQAATERLNKLNEPAGSGPVTAAERGAPENVFVPEIERGQVTSCPDSG